jgi:hypothetical protein
MVNCSPQTVLASSNAVRTIILPEVRDLLSYSSYDFGQVTEYKTSIKDWLSPIIDLSEFHVYPMNGITEGLNWWMSQEKRAILKAPGDYQWVDESPGIGQVQYLSYPSSIDGNYPVIPEHIPLALDLAYLGSSEPLPLSCIANVDFAFFSLSKTFGLRNIRTGWLFSKSPQKKLEQLIYNAKYYNGFAHSVAELVIQNFSITYVHEKLKDQQMSVCSELQLTPSDVVWLATSRNPQYNKFRRGEKNRICLSKFYSAI